MGSDMDTVFDGFQSRERAITALRGAHKGTDPLHSDKLRM